MNLSEDNESIARAWIVFTLSEPDSDEYELNFWAFQKMSDLSVDDSYRALDTGVIAFLTTFHAFLSYAFV